MTSRELFQARNKYSSSLVWDSPWRFVCSCSEVSNRKLNSCLLLFTANRSAFHHFKITPKQWTVHFNLMLRLPSFRKGYRRICFLPKHNWSVLQTSWDSGNCREEKQIQNETSERYFPGCITMIREMCRNIHAVLEPKLEVVYTCFGWASNSVSWRTGFCKVRLVKLTRVSEPVNNTGCSPKIWSLR